MGHSDRQEKMERVWLVKGIAQSATDDDEHVVVAGCKHSIPVSKLEQYVYGNRGPHCMGVNSRVFGYPLLWLWRLTRDGTVQGQMARG